MRSLLWGDIIAAARYLAAVPAPRRETETRALFWRAHIADKVMKRLRRPHSVWGNGSLTAAASASDLARQPERFATDPAFLDALLHVLTFQNARLIRHRQKKSLR